MINDLTNINNVVGGFIEITAADLPLQCPMLDTVKWNLHPRVFLAIEQQADGIIICPYCSTRYKLV